MKKSIVFLLVMTFILCTALVHADWFPITAWDVKHDETSDISWIDSIAAWNGNSILLGYKNYDITKAFLTRGKKRKIDFILYGLSAGEGKDISFKNLARGQLSVYESEEHDKASLHSWPPASGYFDLDSCTGKSVYDFSAKNKHSWRVNIDSHLPGYIQFGLTQQFGHRQDYTQLPTGPYTYSKSIDYEALFYLKAHKRSVINDTVCRLEITRKDSEGKAVVLEDTILTIQNFPKGKYKYFSLSFSKEKSMIPASSRDYAEMDYRIYWYGNHDLHADRVEVRDDLYNNLLNGVYNKQIKNIIKKWNGYTSLKYYYLWDEPHLDQFNSFRYVIETLEHYKSKPALTTINHRYGSHYNLFSEFVKIAYEDVPTPLLIYKYVLRGGDDTQEEIQERFDLLCEVIDAARESADTTGRISRDVWYICQAHGYYKQNGKVILRDPTPEELWALVGLALAHGAKGIWYFIYMSKYYPDGSIMFRGLVEKKSARKWIHNNKWKATKDINLVLKKLGPIFLKLEFQGVFRGNNLQDYLAYSSLAEFSEFGLFRDHGHDYFLIVSRKDGLNDNYPPLDSSVTTVGIDKNLYGESFYIKDCYSGAVYRSDTTRSDDAKEILFFAFYLKNGHFKLFKIIPFD